MKGREVSIFLPMELSQNMFFLFFVVGYTEANGQNIKALAAIILKW